MSRKIVNSVIILVFLVTFYNGYTWIYNNNKNEVQGEKVNETPVNEEEIITTPEPDASPTNKNDTVVIKKVNKKKTLYPFLLNACSVLDIFYIKPTVKCKHSEDQPEENSRSTSIAIIGIISFLVALALTAVFDVMKAKEEELKMRSENLNDYRRGSLAEFANKKPLRRESSKFSFNLFQIAEAKPEDEKREENRRQVRPYKRGESTNSYLSEKKNQEEDIMPLTTASETPTGDLKNSRRQSKLFGARPVTRRSSFPAINDLNPEVQAAMLARSNTIDNDEDSEGKGRRIRLIRRY